MPRKIIDIIPPEKIKKPKEIVSLVKERRVTLPKISPPSFFGFLKKPLIYLLILILIGAFSYFFLPKAEIVLFVESEPASFNTKFIIDNSFASLDFTPLILPAQFLEVERAAEGEFSSSETALKEEKAEGIIRIYNAYSTSPQVLIANTRFVSSDGKLFRLIERVTVPGGHYEGDKLTPGFLDAEVRADEAGEEFNIEPSVFSIPGFKGTPRYTYFYGRSFQALTGGLKKEVIQVTQEDLDKAKSGLTDQAIRECREALDDKVSPDSVLLERAIKTEILEENSSAQAEDEVEKFSFRVKALCSALVFKSQNLEEIVDHFLSQKLPTGKSIYEDSLKTNYSPETIDFESGKITLSLTVSGEVYSDIDEASLKEALRGKSLKETQFYLENYPQITEASVNFWPFWVQKVPQSKEKIVVELKLDSEIE
jgi:hypothetical protein